MRIIEGWLPPGWCIVWYVLSIIIIVIGILQMKKIIKEHPESKKLIAANGVLMFIVSLLQYPVLTGTESNPAFNGISGALFGPAVTSVIGAVVLLLQTFLLACGGLTTLGADIFSLTVGALVAYVVFCGLNKHNCPSVISIIFSVILANIASSLTTGIQMALVYGKAYQMIVISFIGQVPMGIIDVIVSVIVFVILSIIFKESELFSNDSLDYLKR